MKKNLSEENLYGKLIRNELELLQSLPDGYLYHGHLEEHNNPVCFHQFADAVATHGLQYVADAEFSKAIGQDLSEKARQGLLDADKAQQEQYMDFLRNETFRKSILSYASIPLQKSLDISAFERFFVALVEPLQSSELELTSTEPAAFDIRRVKIECSHPIVKASLSYLGKIWPKPIRCDVLYREAESMCEANGCTDMEDMTCGELVSNLIALYKNGIREAHVHPPSFVTEVSQPARGQAAPPPAGDRRRERDQSPTPSRLVGRFFLTRAIAAGRQSPAAGPGPMHPRGSRSRLDRHYAGQSTHRTAPRDRADRQ